MKNLKHLDFSSLYSFRIRFARPWFWKQISFCKLRESSYGPGRWFPLNKGIPFTFWFATADLWLLAIICFMSKLLLSFKFSQESILLCRSRNFYFLPDPCFSVLLLVVFVYTWFVRASREFPTFLGWSGIPVAW